MSRYSESCVSLASISFALIIGIVCLTSGVLSAAEAGRTKPIDLRCEYATDPLGIDEVAPRFSWRIDTEAREAAQTAYRVLVASSAECLTRDEGDLWDSGRVDSPQSANVVYVGKPLVSRQHCWWKVCLWDEHGDQGAFSAPAGFEMALLESGDWQAEWIGGPPAWPGRALSFRSSFKLSSGPRQARLYIAGLGYYESILNGEKLGDAVLEPAVANTAKRIYYRTYDVTAGLRVGENVLAALVGAGWEGRHLLRAQLEIACIDGTKVVVATGLRREYPKWQVAHEFAPEDFLFLEGHRREFSRWEVAPCAILSDSIYDGESYDARLENSARILPGYTVPKADQSHPWFWASVADGPTGRMCAQPLEAIKVVEELTPRSVRQPRPGTFVFDFGRNHAGWARLRVRGPTGTKITLRYAELLTPEGLVNQDNLQIALAEDSYVLRGGTEETWAPRFTYHGYRYVQVEGWPGTPGVGALTSCVVRSDVPSRGKFECSDGTLNRIHQIVRWTEESNLYGVPTDCPQRPERLGWLNDLGARSEELVYNYDALRLLEKFVTDIGDAQDAGTGAITDTAPFHQGYLPADPVSVSYLLIPSLLHQHYGDTRVLARNGDGMRRWVDYLTSRAPDSIVNYSYWGDWAPPAKEAIPWGAEPDPEAPGAVSKNTPGELISTACYFCAAKLYSQMAAELGHGADESAYKALAQRIRAAFHRKFWKPALNGYGSGNQACNAIALYLDLVPTELRSAVVSSLVRAVEQADYHLTTGNLCTKYLLEVLSAEGHGDVALKIATQHSYPSWGYMLDNGATTMWERWDLLTGNGMNSHNHPMNGSVGAWLYRWVAGLALDEPRQGQPRFIFQPPVLAGVSYAQAELPTMCGSASISWKRENLLMRIMVHVPWNCTATVRLPGAGDQEISAGDYDYTIELRRGSA